jgi:GT2 family glycosyltransferase
LATIVEEARDHDLVGGRLDEETLNGTSGPSRPRMPVDQLPLGLNFLPFATFANFAIWRDVLADLGGFDEAFLFGNDDVELCFRAQTRGFRLGYAPAALVSYRHRDGGRDLFRQFFRYGANEPLLYERYRSLGMCRPSGAEVARRWARLAVEAPLALSPQRRGAWLVRAGFSAGRLSTAARRLIPYL